MKHACLCIVLLLLCSTTFGKKKEKEFKYEPKETSKTVVERKLVDEQIISTTIIKESASYYDPSQRTFAGPTLGYITPWNNQGYAFATLFKDKFDYLSPCWYLIRPESLEFVGDHEVNRTWMSSVKPAKVLPRFLFDGWHKTHFSSFFANKNQQTQAISKIVELCDTYSFDGIVVDTGYIGLTVNRQQQVEFYKNLATSLKAKGKLIILVVPPHFDGYNLFGSQELFELANSLDHISIMTYDYSREGAGPNSPLYWWYKTLFNLVPPDQRGNSSLLNKLMFGINFYGYDYTSNGKKDAILGSKFLEILNKNKPQFEWEESSHEHKIEYKDKSVTHTVYFPTPLFLQDRLHFASQSSCGVAIWEIGQGLHYFYDLL